MRKYTRDINFVIRDIDSGIVKEEFRSPTAAKQYLRGMPFGLAQYYEIYDVKNNEVIMQVEKSLNNRGYKDIREVKHKWTKNNYLINQLEIKRLKD